MKCSAHSRSVLTTLLLLAAILLAACQPTPTPRAAPTEPPQPTAVSAATTEPTALPASPTTAPETSVPVESPTPVAVASGNVEFAVFDEPAVEAVPAVEHEPIAADLSNVRVAFALSDEQRQRLAADGVVASPGTEKEFFTVYEKARYANVPILVTSDSLLHVYHLLFDKTLRTAEVQYFIPLLRDLNAALLERTDANYQAVQGTGWEDAARRTVAFAGVASRLLDPNVQVPAYAEDLVKAELALIDKAGGIMPSPLFPGLELGEDYTQYIPRGHYTRSDELKAYFKSMMWYGRMTFRLRTKDPEVGRAETRSALLLAHALRSASLAYRPAVDAWADLYNPTAFFVGRSDDLTVMQYLDVIDAVYGPDAGPAALADEAKLDEFIAAADELPAPRILGMVIFYTDDEEETTKGMRFMGQRFVPDAYIFRQLIFRNVGTPDHRRGLPKGLDLLAAMGSERAYQILDEMGETKYEKYPEQMAKVQQWVANLTVAEWTETLYNSWLYSFQPLLAVPGPGYPAFMQSQAWVDKQMHTVLGSWAELKHDTILYAKQVYAEAGGAPPPPEPVPPKNYVEPVPEFYARLAALTAMTRSGLGDRGLLNAQDAASLEDLEGLALELKAMAEKELRGEALSEDEERTVRFYGSRIEGLTMAAADKEGEEGGIPTMDEEPQAAVIADVATDPDADFNGSLRAVVLEEGVGRIDEIHAVVPVVGNDGETYLQVAKGAIFSYYEFPWPAEDRLTDEKWRAMLDEGQAPARPEWIGSFWTEEGEQSDLTQAIYDLQTSLVLAVWEDRVEYLNAKGDALEALTVEIKTLVASNQYEGRQLLSSEFRSFDRQSADKAVVTVRETWRDSLYEIKDFAGEGGEALAERGPYTLDVTYTLERVEEPWPRWLVTRIVYATPRPGW